jgi:hypothetical protein
MDQPDQTSQSSTPKASWRQLTAAMHLHLNPDRLIQIINNRLCGIALVRVGEKTSVASDSPSEPALFNHPWSQWRITFPNRLREKMYDPEGEGGVSVRKVGLFSAVPADQFLGDLEVSRPTWVLVLRGRLQESAGRLSGYADFTGSGQAKYEPIFSLPKATMEPSKLVS